MKYSIPVKFIAFLLAACALVAAFGSILGIVQVAKYNLYTESLTSWVGQQLDDEAFPLARKLTERFAVAQLTNCSEEILRDLGYWHLFDGTVYWNDLDDDSYHYTITTPAGQVLRTGGGEFSGGYAFDAVCSAEYPIIVLDEQKINSTYGKGYLRSESYYMESYDANVAVRFYESPEYIVKLTIQPGAFLGDSGTSLELVELVYNLRYWLMVILTVSILILACGCVYLCCAAGRTSRRETVIPAGLNRLPLDLYAAGCGIVAFYTLPACKNITRQWLSEGSYFNPGTLIMVAGLLLAIAVCIIGFFFACSAQAQCRQSRWWNNLLLVKLGKGLWHLWEKLGQTLPLIWRSVVLFGILSAGIVAGVLLWYYTDNVWLLLGFLLAGFALIVYYGFACGTLVAGMKRMAQGDLQQEIPTRFLVGAFAQSAKHLNTLADVAMQSAKREMRSERMKTELITNVSHDIKTPLTSIINYVDLLGKTDDPKAAAEYLEVLSRQSQRMKKLIEDLMEMSRLSSGNITAFCTRIDGKETLQQALGEFSDKFLAAHLTPVLSAPEMPVWMTADGRLTWRVLSNLLSNVVKYAMPETRVYIDLTQEENETVISIKNISREPLNVSAEELTERFVRGDVSRNTEGNGLGLNIAQGLMDAQKGSLSLFVDGDLFKVTLRFHS